MKTFDDTIKNMHGEYGSRVTESQAREWLMGNGFSESPIEKALVGEPNSVFKKDGELEFSVITTCSLYDLIDYGSENSVPDDKKYTVLMGRGKLPEGGIFSGRTDLVTHQS